MGGSVGMKMTEAASGIGRASPPELNAPGMMLQGN
jgi:hypothetical protein